MECSRKVETHHYFCSTITVSKSSCSSLLAHDLHVSVSQLFIRTSRRDVWRKGGRWRDITFLPPSPLFTLNHLFNWKDVEREIFMWRERQITTEFNRWHHLQVPYFSRLSQHPLVVFVLSVTRWNASMTTKCTLNQLLCPDALGMSSPLTLKAGWGGSGGVGRGGQGTRRGRAGRSLYKV